MGLSGVETLVQGEEHQQLTTLIDFHQMARIAGLRAVASLRISNYMMAHLRAVEMHMHD
jgi:hypothetical protein